MRPPMKKKKILRRGFSMLEALTASTILVLGLTGILMMLNNVVNHSRDGSMSLTGATMANREIQEFQALGWVGLQNQALFDAGAAYDSAGRRYGRTVAVTAFASDAGIPSFQVDVTVTWRDALGVNRRNIATTVVSQVPDAG